MFSVIFATASTIFLTFSTAAFASEPTRKLEPLYQEMTQSFRKTLDDLIRADTTNPPGNEARAVKILAKRLDQAGISYQIDEFAPGRQSLVARIKGDGSKKPLLLLSHIDVVGADKQNWTVPPHQLTEKDGYLYGRGVYDDLGMTVANLEILILLKKNKTPLLRDVIVAFTGDEESGGEGIQSILKNHPEWVDAEIALNESGSLRNSVIDGPVTRVEMQLAEKIYQDFEVTATGTTGHSSIPKSDNAIHRLSIALAQLAKHQPAPRLSDITREAFLRQAETEKPTMRKAMLNLAKSHGPLPKKDLAIVMADPFKAAALATTCIATVISGGTRVNALPGEAKANVNCRIHPSQTPLEIQKWLEKTMAVAPVTVKPLESSKVPGPSPLNGVVPLALRKVMKDFWPKAHFVPIMGLGATDSRYLRAHGIQAYGLLPFANLESDTSRMHGIDERIQASAIAPGLQFYHAFIIELAAAK